MTAADKIVVVFALLIISLSFYLSWQPAGPGDMLDIYQGNDLFQSHSLHEQATLRVPGTLGDSVVEIRDGRARFQDSPCQSKFCIHSGWLRQTGGIIACLPNGIILQISGGDSRMDALAF